MRQDLFNTARSLCRKKSEHIWFPEISQRLLEYHRVGGRMFEVREQKWFALVVVVHRITSRPMFGGSEGGEERSGTWKLSFSSWRVLTLRQLLSMGVRAVRSQGLQTQILQVRLSGKGSEGLLGLMIHV